MKKLQPYLPFIMLAIAAVAGIYFFYYKPKKDKVALDQAAAQSAADAELTAPIMQALAPGYELVNTNSYKPNFLAAKKK